MGLADDILSEVEQEFSVQETQPASVQFDQYAPTVATPEPAAPSDFGRGLESGFQSVLGLGKGALAAGAGLIGAEESRQNLLQSAAE